MGEGIFMRIFILRGKKYTLTLIIGAIAFFTLLLIALWPTYWLSLVSSQARLVPIYEVATDQPEVAISFDASWGAEYTPVILDTLDEYHVKATFFLVNIWLEDYPDMAKEIVARGHEIGLHSTTHPHCSQLSKSQLLSELNDNFKMVVETTGYLPCLFRPPFGDYNNQVVETVNACGYDCIQWSVDSLDWKDLSADEIVQRVMKDIHAGDIILFHNNGLHTAEALPIILDQLKEKGLNAVSVSELLLKGDCYIDYNGIQRHK
jgi:peptidoglycan-N-acetylglucosamine deacetylase